MRIFLLLILLVLQAHADSGSALSGNEWLDEVNRAMKISNYHGTVVFMKNGQVDTMKYQHTFDKGIEYERLTSLNSPLREITRNSSEVSCVYKEAQQKVEKQYPIDRSFIVNLPLKPEKLQGQYLYAVAGQEMVAMRPAQIVAILPKDNLRYARKLWVDTASLLPLKVEVYGEDGKTLEQVMFTDFNIDGADAAESGHSDEANTHHAQASESLAIENPRFELKNSPPGFEKIFFIRNTMQRSQKTVDHLLIGDGFSSVSIYFEAKGAKGMEGLRNLGPINSYSRVIGDVQITVLGEVPEQTVELLAKSVSLR